MKTPLYALVCVIISINVRTAPAKVYTKCGLTQELLRLEFPRSFIGNWVCLIESESGKNTAKMTNKADRSKALGLFQIRSTGWCTYDRPGGKCNMKCEDLLNEDILDDSRCARRVYGERGFNFWDGWCRSCKGRQLPIPKC